MYVLLCHSPEDTCVCTAAGLWTSFNIVCFFFITPAPPLLYIHLSPIHQFTCLSNLPFIFSPAFIRLHSHHFSSSVLTWARYFIWHTPHSSVVSLKVLQGFPGTILSRRGATLHPPSLNLSIIFMKVQLKHVVHRLKCKRGGFCIGHCSAARHLLPHRTELQGYGPHHPDT